MPSIPHSFLAALTAYVAPIAAFVVALLVPRIARGKAWVEASGALALCLGWALLVPLRMMPRVIWAPHRGIETLLAPALACIGGVALVAWRGGRQARWVAVLVAGFAGWWVARGGVGTADFWRVWFAIAGLTWLIGRIAAGKPDRFLMMALALWGGLAVAGAGMGWLMAALVAAAAAAGLIGAGITAALPAAGVATLMGAADLAGGRLLRGRFDSVDLACLAALVAPLLAAAAAARLGRVSGRLAPVLAAAIGTAGTVAVVWLLRRALLI